MDTTYSFLGAWCDYTLFEHYFISVMESDDATIKPKHNPDGNLHKLSK